MSVFYANWQLIINITYFLINYNIYFFNLQKFL